MEIKEQSPPLQLVSEAFKDKILMDFEKRIMNRKSFGTGLLLIHSPSLNIHRKTAAHANPSVFVHPDQPYHFASIGKTITSVMISLLYEKGLIDFDDRISLFLDDSILAGLHIYKGVDYSKDVQVKHLLNHTSGIPDFYTDKNSKGIRLHDLMIAESERFWTPHETIGWANTYLKPKFKPGNGFHYSDTNYELLGLIIERLTGMRLHDAFHHYIFEPLGMSNTYQLFYSEPQVKSAYSMPDLFYKGVNLSTARSISMSCAAGGIVSTSEDMLLFLKAVVDYRIVNKDTFNKMCNYARMAPSLYYGYGIMNFRFMFMPAKYHIWGNSGSIGSFMYYNPAMDIYFIGSFHKVNYQVGPILYIFHTLRKFSKELKKRKY